MVLLVGVSLWALLEAPFVRAKLRSAVAEAVHTELGLDATLGPIEFRLPFRVAVHTVRLTHPEHGLLLAASELLIVPSWRGLLRGELELKRLIVEGARVRLRVKNGEIVNLPSLEARPARDDDQPVQIPLRELVVHRAALEVDARPRLTARFSAVNVVARVAERTRVALQVTVSGGELEHSQGSERIAGAQLTASYRPGHLAVERLHVDSELTKLTITDAAVDLPLGLGRHKSQLSVELDLGRLARLPHGLSLPSMEGKLALRAKLEGRGAHVRLQGDLRGERPVVEGFGFGELDLKIDATEHEVKLLPGSQARIIEDGGWALLTGKIGLTKELPLEVDVKVKELVFQKLMAQLGVTQDCIVDWHLRGGFRLKGTANPVAVSGPIWADHLRFRALTGAYHDPSSTEVIGTPPGHIRGRVVIRPDALRFEKLRGKLPHSEVLADVHVGFGDKLGVSAKSDRLDLRDATGLMGKPIAGAGAFRLEVGGTYDDATLTGSLDLADFVLWDNPIGHLKTRAVLEKDGTAVRFVDSEVRKNSSHYFVDDLFLDFSKAFVLEAKARFERLLFSDFYDSVAVADDPDFAPYQGVASGTATARYTLGFPGDGPEGTLTVDTALALTSAEVHGVAFTGGRLEGTYHWVRPERGARGVRLALRQLRLTRGRGAVKAHGFMEPGTELRFTVLGEALSARELGALTGRGGELEGELSFSGTARGTLDLPELALDVELVGMQLAGRRLGDGNGELHVSHPDDPWVQRALALPADARDEPCVRARRAFARARWTDARGAAGTRSAPLGVLVCGPVLREHVHADLVFGLDEDVSARGRLTLRELPTSWLLPAGAAQVAALEGRVSGSLTLEAGKLLQPDSLVGELALSHLALGKSRVWLTNAGPVRVALTGRGVRIDGARFVGDGTELDVRGSASLKDGLATTVHGTLDLSVASAFVPEIVSSRGLLDVDVKLTGAFSDPAVFGRASLSDARVLTTIYPAAFENIQARMSFSDRELVLEELSTDFAGGTVRAHGSAALDGQALGRYELAVDARDVRLEPSSGIELTLAAETTLTGEKGTLPRLAGTLRLLRARYTRPFSLGIAERITSFSHAKRAERTAYNPANDHLALDLRIIGQERIRIRNNLLNAELAIEDGERPFRLVGTDQRMGLLGTLRLERGTLRFRSTEFRVEDGTVSFFDERSIRPQIDVRARTEFRRTADTTGARWSILLHAHGDVDDLRLETSSEPALASEDIALLLTMGITRAEAERVQTGSLTQGAALEALATVAGVDREVKRALPVIDDFAVTSAYSVRTNRTEPQVVVGKRISERVRASATTGLTTDSNFKTNVEWRLNDQTSVEAGYDNVQTTTASQFGNVGVDLRWRLEFD